MRRHSDGARDMAKAGIVIFNPTAGRGRAGRVRAAAATALGPGYEWRPTDRPGHATELARAAARETGVVVGFGGDGTVGDVARGLTGTDAVLGILPGGTGNDIARNFGVPLDLAAAAAAIRAGRTRRVDVGTLNGVPFVNNAGLGFDACVMRTMNRSIRFCRGKPAFVLAAVRTLFSFEPFILTTARDGGPPVERRAMMAAVLNGPVFAAGMRAAPAARPDDGLLDVLIVRAMPKHRLLALLPQVIAGRHAGHPAVELFTARTLTFTADPPQPLNLDGDESPPAPAEIAVRPAALTVLTP